MNTMGVIKCTAFLCAILAVASLVQSEKELTEIEISCGREHDLDPHEAFEVIKSNDTVSEEIMCYVKCYLEKNDMLAMDGSVLLDKSFEIMFANQTDAEEMKGAFSMALDGCNSQFNKDNCELAGNIYRCLRSAMHVEQEE